MFGTAAVTVVGLGLMLGSVGCKSKTQGAAYDPSDPANVNMASVTTGPVGGPQAQVLGQRDQYSPTQSGVEYPQGNDNAVNAGQEALEEANSAPPPLPEYTQPQATRANTIWTPGYWRYAQTGYYWVPGAWVSPPYAGALWTPGYWGADGQRYRFHQGYWGRHVGFYGGVNYGGGYVGTGYHGGYWNGNQFYYNQAFYQVDPNQIHGVYNQPWRGSNAYGRVSYNGGNGGINILPIAAEIIALHEQHERPIRYQYDVERQAERNRGQFYEVNRGRPEAYVAGPGFVVGIGGGHEGEPVIIQRPIVIDERGGFPGRGNAFGHDKKHGNPHDDGGDRGRGDEHGRGGKHDR